MSFDGGKVPRGIAKKRTWSGKRRSVPSWSLPLELWLMAMLHNRRPDNKRLGVGATLAGNLFSRNFADFRDLVLGLAQAKAVCLHEFAIARPGL